MIPARTIGLLAFTLITLFINPGFAQHELLFRIKYLPDKTYTSELVNDMKMEVDFTGDTAVIKKMQTQGMQMPMHLDMLQKMTVSTRTGALTADKRIPVTIGYDNSTMTIHMAGRELKQPDRLSGMMMKGHATEDGKVTVDSIVGTKSPELRQAMEKMISKVLNSVQFPDKPMKPGDTFTQEVPMEMPAGGASMNLLIKLIYTLKEIKNEQAFFDFTQQITLDLSMPQGIARQADREQVT